MRVCSLDQEDPLEEGVVIHSSILAWKIPRAEEPGRLGGMLTQVGASDLLMERRISKEPIENTNPH